MTISIIGTCQGVSFETEPLLKRKLNKFRTGVAILTFKSSRKQVHLETTWSTASDLLKEGFYLKVRDCMAGWTERARAKKLITPSMKLEHVQFVELETAGHDDLKQIKLQQTLGYPSIASARAKLGN